MSGSGLALRRATMEDCWRVYEWRNDPATRRYFVDPTEVARETHAAWFDAVVNDPARHLLIASAVPVGDVGVVRLDPSSAGSFDVHIYLVPGMGGQGWGSHLLSDAAEWARREIGAKRLRALVREENMASRRAFEKAGFSTTERIMERTLDPEGS